MLKNIFLYLTNSSLVPYHTCVIVFPLSIIITSVKFSFNVFGNNCSFPGPGVWEQTI